MRSEQEKTAAIVRAHDCDSARLIAILQEIQASENYLSQENMELVADMLHISVSRVYSVATFYENFRWSPRKAHRQGMRRHGLPCAEVRAHLRCDL